MKAKKSSPTKSKNSFDTISASRAIISLLIILLAASVFLLFKTYQDTIMQNNMVYPFMILTFIGMGLLASLLFLINPSRGKK